jgi:hypothetical protein
LHVKYRFCKNATCVKTVIISFSVKNVIKKETPLKVSMQIVTKNIMSLVAFSEKKNKIQNIRIYLIFIIFYFFNYLIK